MTYTSAPPSVCSLEQRIRNVGEARNSHCGEEFP